jgi:hypothetical protein
MLSIHSGKIKKNSEARNRTGRPSFVFSNVKHVNPHIPCMFLPGQNKATYLAHWDMRVYMFHISKKQSWVVLFRFWLRQVTQLRCCVVIFARGWRFAPLVFFMGGCLTFFCVQSILNHPQ